MHLVVPYAVMKHFLSCTCVLLVFAMLSHAQQRPSFFATDSTQPRIPVTNFHFNTDTNLVQFAILSDRTGGMTPGIFEDAVKKANLLQPQFIMSVGDLINGYSTDKVLIDQQWDEFNTILKPLTVPFFYVPGNHDISNAWMQEEWKRRYGQSHYYFLYKNVLFLALNSQDGGDYGMKEEQVNYFLSVLKKHADVRWTFVFMHQPLWARQQTGFEKIEAALGDRPYTIMAGHTHNYMLSYRNNRKYFILATSGGGSERRGVKFGEFDHITWVSFQQDDPSIVHIELNGVIREDIVDKKIKKQIRPLTSGSWLNQLPLEVDGASQAVLLPGIRVSNTGSLPLRVFGELPDVEGCIVHPKKVDTVIAPGAEGVIPYRISSVGGEMSLAEKAPIEVTLNGELVIDSTTYTLPATSRLMINWPHSMYDVPSKGVDLTKLDTSNFTVVRYPERIDESWDWSGLSDAGLKFKVQQDKSFLYVTAIVNDDKFIIQPGEHRDKAIMSLKDKSGKLINVHVYAKHDGFESAVFGAQGKPLSIKVAGKSRISDGTWSFYFKLPLASIASDDSGVSLNIAYSDQDDPNSQECAVIYWKQNWGRFVKE